MEDYFTYPGCGHTFVSCPWLPKKECPVCSRVLAQTKTHKYHAKPVSNEYGYFQSTGEANRFAELLILQQAGVISDLERQRKYYLRSIKQHVVWDYFYREDGAEVVEDFKGFKTPTYLHKKKWFQHDYPKIQFRETKVQRMESAPSRRHTKRKTPGARQEGRPARVFRGPEH